MQWGWSEIWPLVAANNGPTCFLVMLNSSLCPGLVCNCSIYWSYSLVSWDIVSSHSPVLCTYLKAMGNGSASTRSVIVIFSCHFFFVFCDLWLLHFLVISTFLCTSLDAVDTAPARQPTPVCRRGYFESVCGPWENWQYLLHQWVSAWCLPFFFLAHRSSTKGFV